MKISIRNKLILAISLLVIVLFSIAGMLFISEKKIELADDIYTNALAFSRLTAPTVVYNYDLYLAQNGFVYFNREINSVFDQNADVSVIKVLNFSGEVLYDSSVDTDKKYDGEKRVIKDDDLMAQVKAESISLKTLDGKIVYLKQNATGDFEFVDKFEKPVEALEKGTMIDYFVVPSTEKYSVFYKIDYKNLDERVALMVKRIVYLVLFGIMMGMIMSFVMSLQVTKSVKKLVTGAEGIASGDFSTQVSIDSGDELGFLGKAFNKMAVDLGASVEAKVYKERVARELELATQIQQRLVPHDDKLPKFEGLDISGGLIPAGEIGGDIYDFIKINDDKLLMYLGDVTGHGVPAGIVSSIANALFYGYSDREDIKQVVVDVNRVLKAKTMPTMFLTLCFGQWKPSTKKFSYVNAGHEQIIHYKASAQDVEVRPSGGMALGMIPDVSKILKVDEIDLATGDFIVLYSDGIPESWRNEKEIYGMERLTEAVKKFGKLPTAKEVKEAILADVKAFVNGYTQMDDITIVVIKRTK
jgi:HAMP domain-containing protein